ncbi:MAG: hypothetical protein KGJ23_12795 [Euryarchaeota archaeon]|nr:hypothetical protein [Euryarchaeota archaeon]MDE2045557.1 hypothetical protein [Thermoplasmata archaeon]
MLGRVTLRLLYLLKGVSDVLQGGMADRGGEGPNGVPSQLRLRWSLPENAGLLLLASFVLLGVFLGLEPLLSFSSWGSDSGEYAFLTSALLSHGRFLLGGFTGWGFGYPYFPGMFEVGAGVAGATGSDPLLSLEVAVPALAALSVVPVYLLFRRLYPSEPVALLGAGLVAVAFPRVFVLSHAAPASLGDLLVVGGLWTLLEQRRDPRWWALLLPTSLALVLTHHLSSYFFLLSALGIVVGLELYAPGRLSRRFPAREMLFLGGFTGVLFAYWFVYAPPFAQIVAEGLPGAPLWTAPALAWLGIGVCALLILVRRKGLLLRPGPLWKAHWPGRAHTVRDALLLGGLMLAGLSYLLVRPLPGTSDVVPWTDILWFAPFLVLLPLLAGGRGLGSLTRYGSVPVAWFGAVALSATFALSTANEAIPPDRHVEFLALPLLLLVAMVLGRVLSGLATVDAPRRAGLAFAIGGVVLLVASNAAIVYPPPSLLEGFQEGLSPSDVGMVSWTVAELPSEATLASDHRISDLYFGGSGRPATWGSATCLFVGNNSTCALEELRGLIYPLGPDKDPLRPIDAVAVDPTMRHQGVALDPNAPALPMSSCAMGWLQGSGLVELYDSGGDSVWWVELSALPGPPIGGPCAGTST